MLIRILIVTFSKLLIFLNYSEILQLPITKLDNSDTFVSSSSSGSSSSVSCTTVHVCLYRQSKQLI